jgi:hypothetical protein
VAGLSEGIIKRQGFCLPLFRLGLEVSGRESLVLFEEGGISE